MGTGGRQTGLAAVRHRFRPRFRGLAAAAAVVGGGLLAAAAAFGLGGASLAFAVVAGAVGLVLGGLYLGSPAWKLVVVVGEEGLEVEGGKGERRLALPWRDVQRVWASPSTKTCFVDGGSPERSVLVPGPGAHAPYEIEDREALYDAIVAQVPEDRIREVALLRDAAQAGEGDRGEPPESPSEGLEGDRPEPEGAEPEGPEPEGAHPAGAEPETGASETGASETGASESAKSEREKPQGSP